MAEEHNHGLVYVAIIAIVAIVAIVVLISGRDATPIVYQASGDSSNIGGQASNTISEDGDIERDGEVTTTISEDGEIEPRD